MFYIDGAKNPQLTGTGTEDYFNEAWGLRNSFSNWYGTPVAEGERIGARLTGYRWHVPDPIPFTKSLWAGIEHAGWTHNADGSLRSGFEERPDYFSSAAFWYQKGVNEDLAEPPYGEARLPLGNAYQIAVEDSLADVTAEKGKASVQREVDWGRDLLFFEAEGVGSRINIPIDVPETGRFEVVARIAQAPDYGDYYALMDGKPTNLDNRQAATSEIPQSGSEVFHNFLPAEIYVAVDHPLGWLDLTKGRHMLSFVCVGHDGRSAGYHLGVNDVILERVPEASAAPVEAHAPSSTTAAIVYRGRPLSAYASQSTADAMRAIGSFGKDAVPALGTLERGLGDSDVEIRLAAAWAFSQIAGAAAPSLPALEHALSDPSVRVRCMTALALRAMGPKAAPAVPALIKALNDAAPYVRAPAADALGNIGAGSKDAVSALGERLLSTEDQTYVLRSVAAALGNIGPAAASALPVLQQALKLHRVVYTAKEAILKINNQPIPSWFEPGEQNR